MKIRNLFLTDDEPKKEVQKGPTAPSGLPTPLAAASSDTSPLVVDGATLDVKGIEEGIEALIRESAEFAPAAAFFQADKNLTTVISDEATRFRGAAATTGTKIEILTSAVSSYKNVLVGEGQKFESTYVAGAQAEIEATKASADAIEQKLVDLTKQMGDLSAQRAELARQITTKTANLGKAKIDFQSVVNTVDAHYADLLKKLAQHLGAA